MRPLRRLLASALFLIPVVAAAIPFDVQIYDRTEGRYLPSYQYEGRTYVVGKPGNEYAVALRNQSGERVLAVGSVDGVNIVTGETAGAMQSGYVLSPGQSAEITGWRKSMANTAAFFFTEHGNSYAARTGRPANVGVIGVAIFRERRPEPPVRPYYRHFDERSSAPAPYGSAAPQQDRSDLAESIPAPPSAAGAASAELAPRRAEKSLGTGHGRIEESQTRYTDFQRASTTPDQVLTLYYDTYSNLLAMGVPVWREGRDRYASKPQPRPFPRDPNLGFVPDPR